IYEHTATTMRHQTHHCERSRLRAGRRLEINHMEWEPAPGEPGRTRGLEAPFLLERIAVSAPDPFAYSSICEALDQESPFCDLHHSRGRGGAILEQRLEERTLRGASPTRRGKSEARAEPAKWLCLV